MFGGHKNDATIRNELLQTDIWNNFRQGDILVLDRGFRDSEKPILDKGFVFKMRFKYFGSAIQNMNLKTIFLDFKIACTLLNLTFTPAVITDLDFSIIRMIQNEVNFLSELVKQENLNVKRSHFERLEIANLEYFPNLILNNLYIYICGTYQLKQAASHCADHINENGDFEFQIAKTSFFIDYQRYGFKIQYNSILLQVRQRSRHSMNNKYFCYVLIDKSKIGLSSIIGHTCTCKVRLKVVGCCSHIAMILWYFGFVRNQPSIKAPAEYLTGILSDEMYQSSDNSDKYE